jgi:D-erythrulose 4-kinase
MTLVCNDPQDFAREALEGLVAANRQLLRLVPGGVTRAAAPVPGRVAVVVGGGSGHYPAFAGLVGRGLAHGAVVGNVFASPSAQQICAVARQANSGGGVLFSYGNYAGDVLHFGAAIDRLTAEGIETRQVVVTDDVSSAAADDGSRRRGIAGDLVVFKIAGAAADTGRPLAEVARLAELANQRTRSFGVAFAGCTLPGAQDPLFTIPAGRMAVGMGIHGEPGIGEADLPRADELAAVLVSRLVSERPPDSGGPEGARAVVLLNGLGSVKYEELFVLYRRVDELLGQAGVVVVEPEVGELVTSLDMAGVSLTLCWLTEELEELWHAPAEAPGFRKGALPAIPALPPAAAVVTPPAPAVAAQEPQDIQPEVIQPASQASRAAARVVRAALDAAGQAIDANAEELGRLDAIAGDGDHGDAMRRGAKAAASAAAAAVAEGAGAGTTVARAAGAWADASGGASGALWGTGLLALAEVIGDDVAPGARAVAAAVSHASAAVMRAGKAGPGDKTLVDALVPFAAALTARAEAGLSLGEAWAGAAAAADEAARATAGLVPRVGHARPLAARSAGHPDPGATSLALVLRAVGPVIGASRTGHRHRESP